jgi:hypothetical protein
MIDWNNLSELPRKIRDPHDRERLAQAALAKKAAKHKGRNHWRNWERRKMALDAKRAAAARNDKKLAKVRAHKDQVRAYWSGLRDEHPRQA